MKYSVESDYHCVMLDLFLELELVGNACDLGGRRFGLAREVCLQSTLDRHLDARSLLAFAAVRPGHLVEARRRSVARVCLVEPVGQQRLQLAHVLEAEVQSLESRDGRLGEVVAVQLAHRHADVALRETCSRRPSTCTMNSQCCAKCQLSLQL